MIYIALLRGINVGGKNKINMKELKDSFDKVGMQSVTTYINSGNIIFENSKYTSIEIVEKLENTILDDFSLEIKVLIRNYNEIVEIIERLPDYWQNNKEMKSDVLFLWDEINDESILKEFVIRPNIDTVIYTPGAILWSVARENVTKSGLVQIVSKKIYKKITIRNVNSVRKIYNLMNKLTK